MGNWRSTLRNIDPYVPGAQPKNATIIKLNANENPYPPAPGVFTALHNISGTTLKKYPNVDGNPLRKVLAQYHGLSEDCVMIGNGSDDLIALAFMAYFSSGTPILFPDVTYSFYPVWADLFHIPYKTIPLNEDFRVSLAGYQQRNGGIILPNPNAPTGIGEGLSFLREFLEQNQDSVVIIDEAYVDFGAESALPLLQEFENLVIIRTFSKSRSLAGARIGYALGNREIIGVLDAIKNSYNSYTIDSAAIAMGVASIEDDAYFRATLKKICDTREYAAHALTSLGFTVYPSASNFLFVTHKTAGAKELMEYTKAQGVYIRYFNLPRIDNHLRITIGTKEEMDALLSILTNYLKP